jgi:hypothetical protein
MKWLMVLLVLSCGRVDVDIADPPNGLCMNDVDCDMESLCDNACDAATGHCRKKPTSCESDGGIEMPQCGCDGVRYASECLRLLAGADFNPDCP